jgi:plasmid stabilization system protein ParE
VTYRVEITDQARDDADAIHAWIAENASPEQAERWYQGLFTQIETLIMHGLAGPGVGRWRG